jgi:hypothetical protein
VKKKGRFLDDILRILLEELEKPRTVVIVGVAAEIRGEHFAIYKSEYRLLRAVKYNYKICFCQPLSYLMLNERLVT